LQECIGIVVSLWHESQTILEIGGTRENISEWSGLFKFSDEKCEKIIFAMKKSRFISQEKDDYFLINGNKTQIDGLMKRITRATKGGKSLKKKWKEVNELEADLKQASSNLEPSFKRPNSSHYNSIQVNSDQINSNQDNTVRALTLSRSPQQVSRSTISISSFKDFENVIDDKAKSNFYALYPDIDFLRREFMKMHNWLISNPKKNLKTPGNWIRFIGNWLDKGWPQYQNSLPSNKADKTTLMQDELTDRISKLFEDAL
jgi:hypothetical protein